MATANQNPASIPTAKSVTFTTTNLSNGETFVEPHSVAGPTPSGTFNIPLNGISLLGGTKVVVPLSTTTGFGSYWLKFHMPQPGSSKMYVTFAQKNNSMADGYYDYSSGIPADFRTALRNWIKDNKTTSVSSTTVLSKSLLFTVYGLDTNKVSSAIQFKVTFKASFGASIPAESAAPASISL